MTGVEQIKQRALAGVGRVNAEAAVGRKFNAEELEIFRAARVRFQLLEEKRKREKAANRISDAERQRRLRARADEVEIPPCANPRRLPA